MCSLTFFFHAPTSFAQVTTVPPLSSQGIEITDPACDPSVLKMLEDAAAATANLQKVKYDEDVNKKKPEHILKLSCFEADFSRLYNQAEQIWNSLPGFDFGSIASALGGLTIQELADQALEGICEYANQIIETQLTQCINLSFTNNILGNLGHPFQQCLINLDLNLSLSTVHGFPYFGGINGGFSVIDGIDAGALIGGFGGAAANEILSNLYTEWTDPADPNVAPPINNPVSAGNRSAAAPAPLYAPFGYENDGRTPKSAPPMPDNKNACCSLEGSNCLAMGLPPCPCTRGLLDGFENGQCTEGIVSCCNDYLNDCSAPEYSGFPVCDSPEDVGAAGSANLKPIVPTGNSTNNSGNNLVDYNVPSSNNNTSVSTPTPQVAPAPVVQQQRQVAPTPPTAKNVPSAGNTSAPPSNNEKSSGGGSLLQKLF